MAASKSVLGTTLPSPQKKLDPSHYHQIMNWYLQQIGKPYDFLAVAAMPFRRDWRDDKRWFCSELAIAGFEQAGIDLLNITHLNRVTPRDLYLSPLLLPTQS
jgi:uncharacterized protein YycO